MEQQIKKYPVDAIKKFFNENYKHIPVNPIWINEHLKFNSVGNSIKLYLGILESSDMDATIKESSFDKLKLIKNFIIEYKAFPEKILELNESKKQGKNFNNNVNAR
jgi:hypothetical protein